MKLFFSNLMDIINNSKFLTILLIVIFVIAAIQTIIYIIKLLSNIRAYIVNKSNSFYLANQKNTLMGNTTMTLSDRIEMTNGILDLITFMVNNEIVSSFKPYIGLNSSYDMSNMDTDIAAISNNIFNGINKELFKDPNLILTEEYLMSFITKKTINIMLDVAQAHNNNIRNINQSVGD